MSALEEVLNVDNSTKRKISLCDKKIRGKKFITCLSLLAGTFLAMTVILMAMKWNEHSEFVSTKKVNDEGTLIRINNQS